MAAIKRDHQEWLRCQYMLAKRYLHGRKDLDDHQHQKNLIEHIDREISLQDRRIKYLRLKTKPRQREEITALAASNYGQADISHVFDAGEDAGYFVTQVWRCGFWQSGTSFYGFVLIVWLTDEEASLASSDGAPCSSQDLKSFIE